MAGSEYWDWRERLAEANDPAFWPIEEIDLLLANGQAQFWCDGKAALVTRLVHYPGGAMCLEAVAGAGDKIGLLDRMEPELTEFARLHGCTHMKEDGRDGWRRELQKRGWRHYQTTMLKELNDG